MVQRFSVGRVYRHLSRNNDEPAAGGNLHRKEIQHSRISLCDTNNTEQSASGIHSAESRTQRRAKRTRHQHAQTHGAARERERERERERKQQQQQQQHSTHDPSPATRAITTLALEMSQAKKRQRPCVLIMTVNFEQRFKRGQENDRATRARIKLSGATARSLNKQYTRSHGQLVLSRTHQLQTHDNKRKRTKAKNKST